MSEEKQAWAGTTYGNTWMHRSLTATLRWIDVRLIYAFAAVAVVPVCYFLPTSKHGYRFMRKALGKSRMAAAWGLYKNLCLFSQVVIDRFAMYAGKKFDIRLEGYEHFERLAQGQDGFVQLSAHVGNYELAGYNLVAQDKPMSALVFGGEKETVMNERLKMFGVSNIKMIAIQDDMSHIYKVNEALASGEIVSMPADRMVGSTKRVEVTLLGNRVGLPAGPFHIASMRGCNVLAVNVMKSATRQYTIIVTPIDYDKTMPRRQQVEQLAQAYANELERVLRLYPHQWYNYYDFAKQ